MESDIAAEEPVDMLLQSSIPRDDDGRVDLEAYTKLEMEKTGMRPNSCMSWARLSYVVEQEPISGVPTWTHNLWRLLTFMIRRDRVPFPLLDDVSGYVEPGMNVLLLGPPGAGKTTLLETLAGRKPEHKYARVSGSVTVNGKPWTSDFKRIAGYVTQNDIHIPTMTVRETVEFSSLLRNHPDIPRKRMLQRVQVALEVLGIDHRADTVVGGELLRGVSGGEKKRVSIAVELAAAPVILFLDEPTTGLDSASAYDVCAALRTLANAGIPVVCSLLQPSQDLYDLFDTVILMCERQCIYFGPSTAAVEHFAGAGYECPPSKNIAEFLLDMCTPKAEHYRSRPDAVPLSGLVEYYKDSPAFSAVATKVMKGVTPEGNQAQLLPLGRTYAASDWTQTVLCTKRAAQTFIRKFRVIVVRVLRAIIIGLLLGSLFFQMQFSVLGANNRVSLLFYCITFTAMGAVASIPAAFEERVVFYHQRDLHFYRTFGYFFSNLVVDIPMSVVEVLLFSLIVYWMTGMYSGLEHYVLHYLTYFVILLFTSVTAKQFCRLVAAASPSLILASSVAPAVLCAWLVFSGFLIPRTSIPNFWIWLNWIDPFRYTFEALAINGMKGIDIECSTDPDEFLPPADIRDDPPYYGNTVCPLSSGDDLLKQFGLYETPLAMWVDFSILAGFYVLFCVLNFCALALLRTHTTGSAGPKAKDGVEEEAEGSLRIIPRVDESSMLLGSSSASKRGATLSFSDLNYCVFIKKKQEGSLMKKPAELQLLFNINGYVEPGTMVALMGASGAGKTTLLDVLAQRKTGGCIDGQIMVNGYEKDQFYNRLIGYVEQFNVFLPTLTVREVLLYNARMRLDESLPDAYKIQRVEEVLDQLHLRLYENRLVGTPESGLSPELRKKLSIGAELVANPKILFLDEPTSGLDSQAADAVMEVTREVCNSGVPVICTIHQPSAELFLTFDSLLLLRPGGRTIYFGPIGDGASTVLSYFRQFGLDCPKRKNPADFVLECSGAGIASASSTDFAAEWDKSVEKKEVQAWLQEHDATRVLPYHGDMEAGTSAGNVQYGDRPEQVTFRSTYAVSFFGQVKETVKRSFMNKYRQPEGNRTYLLTYFVMAVVLGTLYWLQPLSQTGARNRVALIYFLIVFASLGAIASIPGVILQREVYYREKPAFLRPFAYFVAQVLAEIPLITIGSVMFGSLVYFMTGLNLDDGGKHYFMFLLTYVLATYTCVSFSMMMGCVAKTTEVANSLVGISSSIFSLFAGFIIPRESIPWYWLPIHYLSFFSYPLEALSLNEMVDDTFSCSGGGEVQIPVNGTNVPYCPIQDGASFLSYQFTMNDQFKYYWIDTGLTVAFLFAFLALMYFALKRISHLNR